MLISNISRCTLHPTYFDTIRQIKYWLGHFNQLRRTFDQQERIILDLATGKLYRVEFSAWLNNHIIHQTNS